MYVDSCLVMSLGARKENISVEEIPNGNLSGLPGQWWSESHEVTIMNRQAKVDNTLLEG